MQTLILAVQSFAAFGLMLVRLSALLAVLGAIFVPLERLFALHPQKVFRKDIAIDLGYYFISGLVPSLLLSPPLALLAWVVHALLPAGLTLAVTQWPLWQRVMVALVVEEIGYYWAHRWTHEVPLLWQFHAVHHSAEQMDWLVNTRAHPVDMVFTRLCGLAPLYAVGLASPAGRDLEPGSGSGAAHRHALGFLRPRQCALALRPAGVAAGDPGLPSLAPHERRSGPRQQELRRDVPLGGQDVRYRCFCRTTSSRNVTVSMVISTPIWRDNCCGLW